MRTTTLALAGVIVASISGLASAGSVVANPVLDSGSFAGTTVANARFRLDATNWDMRLANTSSPAVGDATKNISNNVAQLAGSWAFQLSFASATGDMTFTLTDMDQASNLGSHSLTINRAGESFNQIQVAAVAETLKGSHLTFGAFSFSGATLVDGASIDLDLVAGSGDSFKNAYLVASGVDLAAIDWALSGTLDIAKGTSTSQERPAFNIYVQRSDAVVAPVIPTPLGGAMGLAGLCAIGARRRRQG
ncbi:MAG: hypothetical protein KF684_05535 [Phycisphaeraceae bacterium]|nr:hypothetical protein [Phycisphaeraceae bacterium]